MKIENLINQIKQKKSFLCVGLDVDLNKIPTGCAPCLKEAIKIDRQVNKRSLNEIKIDESLVDQNSESDNFSKII